MPRRLIAVVVLMLYLLAGALHTFCDLDIAGPRETVVSLVNIDEHGQKSDEGTVAGHHCHGCFPVSVPAPLTAVSSAEPVRTLVVFLDVERDGRKNGIDPPPPKFLT